MVLGVFSGSAAEIKFQIPPEWRLENAAVSWCWAAPNCKAAHHPHAGTSTTQLATQEKLFSQSSQALMSHHKMFPPAEVQDTISKTQGLVSPGQDTSLQCLLHRDAVPANHHQVGVQWTLNTAD